MADGKTYGIDFPFMDSQRGDYLKLTQYQKDEIRADLIHLLLTRRGSRYYLPTFGTRIYEFIFEPFDGLTFSAIESDIRDAINAFMPNLLINSITIEPATVEDEVAVGATTAISSEQVPYIYRVPGKGTADYTAKIKIDYSVDSATFAQSDFVIINI